MTLASTMAWIEANPTWAAGIAFVGLAVATWILKRS